VNTVESDATVMKEPPSSATAAETHFLSVSLYTAWNCLLSPNMVSV